jgi:hypothetical protein
LYNVLNVPEADRNVYGAVSGNLSEESMLDGTYCWRPNISGAGDYLQMFVLKDEITADNTVPRAYVKGVVL